MRREKSDGTAAGVNFGEQGKSDVHGHSFLHLSWVWYE